MGKEMPPLTLRPDPVFVLVDELGHEKDRGITEDDAWEGVQGRVGDSQYEKDKRDLKRHGWRAVPCRLVPMEKEG